MISEISVEHNLLGVDDVLLSSNLECPLCNFGLRTSLGFRGPKTHSIALSFDATKKLTERLDKIQVYECWQCGLLYCDPVPVYDQRATSIIYDEEYCNRHRTITDVEATIISSIGWLSELNNKIRSVTPEAMEFLDVGAGLGFMMTAARKLGWHATGIDLSETVCDYALQITGETVLPCSIFDDRLEEGKFDIISLMGILEHVNDPRSFFVRALSLLKKGGCVYLDVPNENALVMRIGNHFKPSGQTIHLSPCADPFHLVGFSPKTINYLAEDFKLDIVYYKMSSVHLKIPAFLMQRIKVKTMNIIDSISASINHGSEMFVVFRKR